MRLRVGHQHWQFWPILARFMDYHSLFRGPGVVSRLTNPVARLRVGHQHWKVWPMLAHFLDYYSLFWGREAISIVVEPKGAVTCRSSTVAVLADLEPFHRLLLTVLGSRGGFHG